MVENFILPLDKMKIEKMKDKRIFLLGQLLKEEVMHLFDTYRNEIIQSAKLNIPYANDCIVFYERYIKRPEDAIVFACFKGSMKGYFHERDEIRFVYKIENMIYEMNHYPQQSMDTYWEQEYWKEVEEELKEKSYSPKMEEK